MQLSITGASGFVGSQLSHELREKSTNFIRHSDTLKITNSKDKQLISKLDGSDVCIHLAGRAHIMSDNASDSYQAYYDANVTYTELIAQAAISAGVKRFIYISSIKVNGEATIDAPFKADDVPNPQDNYGVTKYLAEQMLLDYHKQGKIEVVIIRPPLIYGPNVKGNLATLARAIQKKVPLPLTGIANNKRSLVALDNLCDLIKTCITHPNASGEIFLVSDGEPISTKQLCEYIAHGKRTKLIGIPLHVSLLKLVGNLTGKSQAINRLTGNLEVDISKNKEVLNWQPIATTETLLPKAFV